MTLLTLPRSVQVNSAGQPYAGALLNTYAAGTNTPLALFTGPDYGTPHPNPLVADATGLFPAFFADPAGFDIRMVLTTSDGTLLYEVPIVPASGVTAEEIGLALYPRTDLEQAANVTPINYGKWPSPWKDISRFVSVNDGSVDVAAQFRNAIAAEKSMVIPQGSYRFDSEVIIADGMTIEGVGKGASVISMGAAAGLSKAAFRANVFAYNINVRNLKIQTKNAGLSQIGLRFAELRSSRIENIYFEGEGSIADSSVGVQFDGGGTFTGDVTVSQCYFANHQFGVHMPSTLGDITTVRIIHSEFYGSLGHPSSRGINIGPGAVGILIEGNTFNIWHRGVYSQGRYIDQFANYFEDDNPQFEWDTVVNAVLNNNSDDKILGLGVPIYSTADTVGNQVSKGAGFLVTGQIAQVPRGVSTYGRAYSDGFTQPVAYSAGNFGASGSMTWVPSSGQVTNNSFSINGKTLHWGILVEASTIGGTQSTGLTLTIPGGFASAGKVRGQCWIMNNNVASVAGYYEIAAAGTAITVYVDASKATNWTLSANTGVSLDITIPVS